jgi:hypothetical protein
MVIAAHLARRLSATKGRRDDAFPVASAKIGHHMEHALGWHLACEIRISFDWIK